MATNRLGIDIKHTSAKCNKCGSDKLYLVELWKDHSVGWLQENGSFDYSDGNCEVGNPYKVEATCQKCKNNWTVKGAKSINDLFKTK